MSKIQTQAQKINDRIKTLTADHSTAIASYRTEDNSVQAELRLSANWEIKYPVDEIHYPKRLGPAPKYLYASDGTRRDTNDNIITDQFWTMSDIAIQIRSAAHLKTGSTSKTIPINERTKTGPERRAEAKAQFQIDSGRQFLTDYRAVTGKRAIAQIRARISALQAGQKALLPQLRRANSAYLAGLKSVREDQARKNTEALASGRFWEADKDALKGYFHPPFDKNYLADVSEKWRAALFLECKSESYQYGYDKNWGHKLVGTGRGYLCGIDDNGDEWGFRVSDLPQSYDDHGNAALDSTVEEAMANLFDIPTSKLTNCQRQGDLLFCPVKIRTASTIVCDQCGAKWETYMDGQTTRCKSCYSSIAEPRTVDPPILTPQENWEVRESHEIWSPALERNGNYFRSIKEIVVSHTSHEMVVLPAGEYRLYALPVEDAD